MHAASRPSQELATGQNEFREQGAAHGWCFFFFRKRSRTVDLIGLDSIDLLEGMISVVFSQCREPNGTELFIGSRACVSLAIFLVACLSGFLKIFTQPRFSCLFFQCLFVYLCLSLCLFVFQSTGSRLIYVHFHPEVAAASFCGAFHLNHGSLIPLGVFAKESLRVPSKNNGFFRRLRFST